MLRPLAWCLGLGAASTALTVATGGAAPLAAALVGGVALLSGAAGNFGHGLCQVLDQRVAGKLLEGRSGFAENHVVAQKLRLAQLEALGEVLKRFDAARVGDRDQKRRREAERFSAELAKFVAEQTKSAETLTFAKGGDVTPKERELRQEVLKTLPDAFDQSLAARRMAGDAAAIVESLGQIRRMVEAAVLAELRLTLLAPGEEPPVPFPALFAGIAMPDGWFDLFIRDAADRIKDAEGKDGGAFEKIWNAEQTAMIKAIVEAHSEMLRDIKTDTEKLLAGHEREAERAAVESERTRHDFETLFRSTKLQYFVVERLGVIINAVAHENGWGIGKELHFESGSFYYFEKLNSGTEGLLFVSEGEFKNLWLLEESARLRHISERLFGDPKRVGTDVSVEDDKYLVEVVRQVAFKTAEGPLGISAAYQPDGNYIIHFRRTRDEAERPLCQISSQRRTELRAMIPLLRYATIANQTESALRALLGQK